MSQPEPMSGILYEPRWPRAIAWLVFVLAALTLCAPMLGGRWLLGDDQFVAGYAFRLFGAEYFQATGNIPGWNPYLFGGMPFIAAMHGDIFYPTAWLRWVLPVDVAMNIGFAVHIVLAGGFMYLFLRSLRLSWTAAVAGGVAYELTGIIASLVSPGHDGKLFVSALMPLAFFALLRAIRDRRPWGYGLFALVVGLALLSPHYQLTYYMLVACGLWTLWLALADPERPEGIRWPWVVAAAFGAVVLGLGLSALQAIPFLEYIKWSPRAVEGTSRGWDYATNFSLPLEELLSTILPRFNGVLRDYWGQNPLKLHTEYLGVPVLISATLAFGTTRYRKLVYAFLGIGILFLLVSLGGHTPFYRLWYEVMPMMKSVRAPGMAFILVALPVCVLAAIGMERLIHNEIRWPRILVPAAVIAGIGVLGVTGGLQNLANAFVVPQRVTALNANADALTEGSLRLLFVTAVAGIVFWAIWNGMLRNGIAAAALIVVIAGDLWSIDRLFFNYASPAREVFADDPITTHLRKVAQPDGFEQIPFRVLNQGVYQGSTLMAYRIQNVLGYHGNEVRMYDDLLGGKNVYQYVTRPGVLDLLATRFLILQGEADLPGYHKVLGPVRTAQGPQGVLYEADSVPPYVRVMANAARIPEEQLTPTIVDPRFPLNQLVVYPDTASISPRPIQGYPLPATDVTAEVTSWEPGRMEIALSGKSPVPVYLLISETWYPDWHAEIDGVEVEVLRGDKAFLSLEIPPGAQSITLWFESGAYTVGKVVSLVSLMILVGVLVAPRVLRTRSEPGV